MASVSSSWTCSKSPEFPHSLGQVPRLATGTDGAAVVNPSFGSMSLQLEREPVGEQVWRWEILFVQVISPLQRTLYTSIGILLPLPSHVVSSHKDHDGPPCLSKPPSHVVGAQKLYLPVEQMKKERVTRLGAVAHAYNLSNLGGQGGQIT
ncbi:hypothetical protein AAY473_033256 [Plecturocebus cupreus]